MTNDPTTPPTRIWADPPETFDGMDVWRNEPGGKGVEYILATEADAMVAAALRGAAGPLTDAEAYNAALGYRQRDQELECSRARWWHSALSHRTLALIPQPASAALDKLIAEAVNNAMLQCVCLVAEVRNAQQPGPIFAALNEAMGRIENARFTAIREAKGAKP